MLHARKLENKWYNTREGTHTLSSSERGEGIPLDGWFLVYMPVRVANQQTRNCTVCSVVRDTPTARRQARYPVPSCSDRWDLRVRP